MHAGGASGQRHLQGMGGTDLLAAARAAGLVSAQAHDPRANGRDVFNELLDFALIVKLRAPAVGTAAELDFDLFINGIGPLPARAGMALFASGPLRRRGALFRLYSDRTRLQTFCSFRFLI